MAFFYRRTILIWMSLSAIHLSLFGIARFILSPFSLNGMMIIFSTLQLVPCILYRLGLPTLDPLTGFRIPVPTPLGLALTVIFWSIFYWLIASSLSQIWKFWRWSSYLGKDGHNAFHVKLSELRVNLADLKYSGFFPAFAVTKPRHERNNRHSGRSHGQILASFHMAVNR